MKLRPVRSLYAIGCAQREIAEILGSDQRTISRYMVKHAIRARKPSEYNKRWGKKNGAWKGNSASYDAMHKRLYVRWGRPKKCDECGSTDKRRAYDWANVTGDYGNVNDYRRLCRSCHRIMDRGAKREDFVPF